MEIRNFLIIFLFISCVKSQSVVDHHSANTTQDLTLRDYTNLTRIENVLNVFNIEFVGRNWIKVHDKINKKCAHNLMQYLDGLQGKKTWAMKSK